LIEIGELRKEIDGKNERHKNVVTSKWEAIDKLTIEIKEFKVKYEELYAKYTLLVEIEQKYLVLEADYGKLKILADGYEIEIARLRKLIQELELRIDELIRRQHTIGITQEKEEITKYITTEHKEDIKIIGNESA